MIMGFLIYLLKMSLSFTLLYLLYLLLLRRSTFNNCQRAYLLLLPTASILIPLAKFPEKLDSQPIQFNLPEILIKTHVITPVNEHLLSLQVWLIILYGLGLTFMITRFVLRIVRLLLITNKAKFNSHWQSYIVQPTDFHGAGSFFNVLFLQGGKIDNAEPLIIEHELIHIRQKHWVDIIIAQLFTSFNWFNPLSYLLINSLRLQHEFIADRIICQDSLKKHAYQDLLFAKSFGSINFLEIHSFNKPSYLKIRIMKLNQAVSAKSQLLYYLSAVPVMTLLIVTSMIFSGQATAIGLNRPERKIGLVESRITNEFVQHKTAKDSGDQKVYNQSQTPPAYPGGDIQFMSDLDHNLHYPKEAKAKQIEGSIMVNFIVEKNGSISSAHVIRGEEIGYGLAEAALKAVSQLKNFKPGILNGKKVRVSYSVPITFKLEGTTNKKTGFIKAPVPLYLVDGKEMTNDDVMKLKPSSIKSMNILKDNMAIDKYGSRAANGAVEITMKELK